MGARVVTTLPIHFKTLKGAYSIIGDGDLTKFKLIQDFIVVLLICWNEEDPFKIKSTRVVTTFLEPIRDFMGVLVAYKNEGQIKNEAARVVTTLFIDFPDAQGLLTPKSEIESCQNSNSSKCLRLVLLPARIKIHPQMKTLK